MSLSNNPRKNRTRSWVELALFIEAYVLLGMARGAILLLPFQRITSILGLVQDNGVTDPTPEAHPQIELISWAIQAAANRTPWKSACLAKGLAGVIMLTRRDIKGILYLGLAKNVDDESTMEAHAWLCSGKFIVTGGNGVARFNKISSYIHGTFLKLTSNEYQ